MKDIISSKFWIYFSILLFFNSLIYFCLFYKSNNDYNILNVEYVQRTKECIEQRKIINKLFSKHPEDQIVIYSTF